MAGLLGRDEIGLDEDFFELGGNSLVATRLVTRIRARLGVKVALRTVLERPTVRTLAEVIGDGGQELSPLVPVERNGTLPLSHAQERMWLLHRLSPDGLAYNVPTALRLRGPLDVDRLRGAFEAVGRRHEALRTLFVERNGTPVGQPVTEPRISVETVDLSGTEDPEREALRRAAALARRPFDLSAGPLVRVEMARLSVTEHVVALCMHHIVADGWSVDVLMRDLHAAYAGVAQDPLPVQYADYAAWQRGWLSGERIRQQRDFWLDTLGPRLSVLDLPTDYPRPAVGGSLGAYLHGRLDPDVVKRLREYARHEGTTLFSVLYAAFAAVLAQRSGQPRVVVGVPVANRSRVEAEQLIGFFVNTLPIPATVDQNASFTDLLAEVSQTVLAAFENQDVPFEQVVEALAPERDLSRNPVFQSMFVLQNTPSSAAPALGEVTVERLPLDAGTAKFDLTLMVEEVDADTTTVELEYPTELFTPETAQAVLESYIRLCVRAADEPGAPVRELLRVSSEERRRLLVDWNDTDRAGDPGDVVERLRHFAVATPDAVAITDDRSEVSYRDLSARVTALAHRLASHGVGPDELVLIHGDRGIAVTVAVLGVLAAGAAYVPVDMSMPLPRAAKTAADSGARLLLTAPSHAERAQALVAAADRPVTVLEVTEDDDPSAPEVPHGATERDLAYVIYTSGSTGRPKGAMVHRLGMQNHMLAEIEELGITAADIVVQNAGLTFDVSVWQMLVAFMVGGRSRVVGDETALDPVRLFEVTEKEAATVLEVVPSVLRAALDAWDTLGSGPRLDALRWLMVTGETLPPDLCRRWFARYPHIALVNAYGPAECSDDVTQAVITPATSVKGARVPIGRPLRGVRLYILDEHLEPLPVGVPGELYVGGICVGRGYLADPERTAAAFLPDPFDDAPGARLYRTGDIVRRLPSGELEFLGRRDHQVKIRGQRIELGEVESGLREIDGVVDAVVVADRDPQGQYRLVGYVVGPARPEAVHAELARRLPAAMVPAVLVALEALPLSVNGKVDRAALPPAAPAGQAEYAAPVTAEEKQLCEVFAEVLGVRRVGLDDDFFALGGHSLLATQLIARVRAECAVELPLRALFERTTPRRLTEAVLAAGASTAPPVPAGDTAAAWFPFASQPQAAGARCQVFCLPHGGGGASAYREWMARSAPEVEVVPVQLPGRESRVAEPTCRSASELVERLLEPLLARADRPFALFGHSMGALLAYELAHALVRRGRTPLHLFVSGLDAPQLRDTSGPQMHTWPDERLAQSLTTLRGTPPEVLASPELLRMLLPVLRADAAVTETYRHVPRSPLPLPVTVLNGRDDALVDAAHLAGWSELSDKPVQFIDFDGDHFYLRTAADAVLSALTGALLDGLRDRSMHPMR